METTGERIFQVRSRLGLSQADFAERISVSRGAVGNWERNLGITQKNLTKIADEFGCSLDWLLSGRGNPFNEGSNLKSNPTTKGKKLDRTLFQLAHDKARKFEQTQLGGLASFEDFDFLVQKYYDELLLRKSQFQSSSKEDH